MASLHFHLGGRLLFVHHLPPTRSVIGRSDRCDLALPSETVSRTHCVVERRTDGWWLVDRSRNGTAVNDQSVERHLLAHGDRITLGDYEARFSTGEAAPEAVTAPATPRLPASFEALVEINGDRLAAEHATLTLRSGPQQGRRFRLRHARTTVGGTGSLLLLDVDLPSSCAAVRLARGRPMIEPGPTPVYLDGHRVREITPVLPGEILRLGDVEFEVGPQLVEETAKELASFGEMVGTSSALRRTFGMLARVAAHEQPVLLTGESGTGKELAARAIHEGGPRHDGPFVAVNCAAIAETLFESELFGHEKGAFTGAIQRADGAFHQAEGGTLFLDEVGEMKLDLQAKLLRTLESGEVRRVGSAVPSWPDVRVVAATNRDLMVMVRNGTFRADLYYRLAVLTVHLPSLRERPEDIPTVARTLLARHHPEAQLTDEAVALLQRYEWPGNVRELRNVLTRAFVMGGPLLTPATLSFHPWSFDARPAPAAPEPRPQDDEDRELLLEALRKAQNNRTAAAAALGIPRSTLLYRLRRLGIDT
jgi:transcriptional regulator with AAA-type ATPase domain